MPRYRVTFEFAPFASVEVEAVGVEDAEMAAYQSYARNCLGVAPAEAQALEDFGAVLGIEEVLP